MTRRNLSHEPGDALDELILAARAELDETTAHELKEFGPDFAAVVEAAHARDPQRVPRPALEEALALAPVVVLGAESSQRMSARGQAEFGALLAEARAAVDADAARQRPRDWSSVHVPKASPVRTQRGPRWLWATAAAAAALLALASPMLATRFETAHGTPSQAPWWQHAGGSTGAASHREPVQLPATREHRPQTRELAEPPAPAEPAPVEPVDTLVDSLVDRPTPSDPQPVPKTRKPSAAPTPAPTTAPTPEPTPAESLSARLTRLGGEAESAWQSGDYASAERLHREIIALAPGSRAADLSFGDLFTLARQRSGPAQEQELWREYLAVFPRGRYADDARAGLCRRAASDERDACWQQYLTDFPAGVHRPQAERALGDAAP
ncbi:hypothetical protein [Nannocystis sp.]|uniref:tetratricopeptide repeat protein n=1 Tax=Nannocystis sp. TaxID=1962667 RepID=UPI0025CB8438|nr:hypothetical protein [Nannocystis sp.]MBK7824934.1 hypothetical protein [Nannocystis sp.]